MESNAPPELQLHNLNRVECLFSQCFALSCIEVCDAILYREINKCQQICMASNQTGKEFVLFYNLSVMAKEHCDQGEEMLTQCFSILEF